MVKKATAKAQGFSTGASAHLGKELEEELADAGFERRSHARAASVSNRGDSLAWAADSHSG